VAYCVGADIVDLIKTVGGQSFWERIGLRELKFVQSRTLGGSSNIAQ